MRQFGVKDVANLTFYDLATGKPEIRLDILKMSNMELTNERAELRGGSGNKKIITLEYNRNITFNCQNAVLNPKFLGMQVGKDLTTGAQTVYEREVLVAQTSGTTGKTEVTLSQTPLNGTVHAFKTSDEFGAEVTATIAGNKVQFNDTAVAAGTEVAVYYQYTSGATSETINITADDFSKFYRVTGDFLMVPTDDENGLQKAQIQIAKAKIHGDFNLNLNPQEFAVFDFALEVYADVGNGDSMVQIVIVND